MSERTLKNSKKVESLTHFSSASSAYTFVALHLVLPMMQKLLHSIKECGSCGVFGVKGGLLFNDG
jgi:hypothetical protein